MKSVFLIPLFSLTRTLQSTFFFLFSFFFVFVFFFENHGVKFGTAWDFRAFLLEETRKGNLN